LSATFASASALAPNIFVPIDLKAPPAQFQRAAIHPQKAANLKATGPVHTNRFYTNFIVGSQLNPIFTHPYSLQFTNGAGAASLSGMSVSHVLRSQTVFGPGTPAAYYLNPIGIRSIVFSSADLGPKPVLFTDSPHQFSINAYLSNTAGGTALIGFPVVQGMGLVTSIWYGNTTPLIRSGVFFTGLLSAGMINAYGTAKYRALLADGNFWLIYATPYVPGLSTILVLKNSSVIQGAPNFNGFIQVAKLPQDPVASAATEKTYDKSAGVYATRGVLSGTASGSTGSYTISWMKSGFAKLPLMMYLLPHQVASLSSKSQPALVTAAQLDTTTKGKATAILADSITLVEPTLPNSILFDPYSPNGITPPESIPVSARQMIAYSASQEMAVNFSAQASGSSMYWNGKSLGKFAMLVYATHAFARNDTLASTGLEKLKSAFSLFVNNAQQYPLVYDQQWGGLVSSASYTLKDPNFDYGNTYYNDHHFHYGYFVYAASIIGFLDGTWASTAKNLDFVNSLIRDYGNSVETDSYFPISRMFDWWHGHSWADGLFESGDSKNEESSSEDMMSAYAIKMWGRVIGDANMQARGNLQLAVLRRSLQSYFLMQSSNTVEPSRFIGNKAAGIVSSLRDLTMD
jgi:endo-1,3(4)-beta-glucanase